MRKADLINEVSNKTGVSRIDTTLTIEQTLATIKQTLAAGQSVFLREFGTFQPKHRKAKLGRNIKAGHAVHIPAHSIPHFKPGKEFKAELKRQNEHTV